MSLKSKNRELTIEIQIEELIDKLKKYDYSEKTLNEIEPELGKFRDKLIAIGRPAIPQLINLLSKQGSLSSIFVIKVLEEIHDKRAIIPLVNVLEEIELGEFAKVALIKYGSEVIPEIIKRFEYRIANPIKRDFYDDIINFPLDIIGEIKCDESITFLNNLLDDYMIIMKTLDVGDSGGFDYKKIDWKYRNLSLFHLIDCMVRQQDKRAIPHIEKARDFFPSYYVDYEICQLAINRIENGKIEGYLPMEALELAIPSEMVMNVFKKLSESYDDFDNDDFDANASDGNTHSKI